MTDHWDRINRIEQVNLQRKAMADVQMESSLVTFLLKRFKLAHDKHRIIEVWRERHGEPHLRLAAFNEVYPSFPFLLGCDKLSIPVHRDPQSTEPSRYKKFAQVPFVQAYLQFASTVRHEVGSRSCALVFPRKGFMQGFVIHDDHTEQYWTHGVCQVYKTPDAAVYGREKIYVQPFAGLVDQIYASGRGWHPET